MAKKVNQVAIPEFHSHVVSNQTGTFNVDTISLLASSLISPKYQNIQSLKLLFNLPLSPNDLIELLKNPHSLLSKFVSEIVIAFFKYIAFIDEAYFKQLHDLFKQHEREDIAVLEVEEEQRMERLKQFIQDYNWMLAVEILQRITKHEMAYQLLMVQKALELDFWMGLAVDDKARQEIFDVINKRYSLMEENTLTIVKLQSLLERTDLSISHRERIEDSIAAYQTHQRLSSLEMNQKFIGDLIRDKDVALQLNIKAVVNEEFYSIKFTQLGKPLESQQEKISEYKYQVTSENKWHYFDLHRNLATALDTYTKKYSIDSLPDIQEILKLINTLSKSRTLPKDQLDRSVDTSATTIVTSLQKDEKFRDFINCFKKYYGTEKLPETVPVKEPVSKDIPERMEDSFLNFASRDQYKLSKKDLETCHGVASLVTMKLDDPATNLAATPEVSQYLEGMKEALEKIVSEKNLSKEEFQKLKEGLVANANDLIEKFSDILDFNDLYSELTKLSFLDKGSITPPSNATEPGL